MTATRSNRCAPYADDGHPLVCELRPMTDDGGPPDRPPTRRADAPPDKTADFTDGTNRWPASEAAGTQSVARRDRIRRMLWAAVVGGARPPRSSRNPVHHHEAIPCR
jgi:hypothetical protein